MQLLAHVRTDPGKIELRRKNGQAQDSTTLSNKEAGKVRGLDMLMIFQEPMTLLHPENKVSCS
ncbi:hypothetical protein FCL47_10755 [Desulfopila sp. IMCC35006]|uniref:hypothetical protein n=1 Tax=Desulfopila sp. IMCC35006 TaxID=2569542 RepID=UPI0010AD7836|nr:hypothetical protein [Desulfopila sp. IMCC35006]TKB26206.1 hypothetical protein FCL47_10755 [Desulfopila sp. IMCC35006]